MTKEEKSHKDCYEQIIKRDGKKLILLDELKEAYLNGYKQGQKDYVTNDRSYVIETKELSYIEIAKENGKLKERIESYKALDSHYDEVEEDAKRIAEENEQLKAQIDQLSNDNHVLKTAFITQQEMIEKMKPYCKELCKNYIKTEFLGNDCYNGVCRNCDKWEWKK